MNEDTPTKVSWPRIHECTTTTTTTTINIEMYTLYEGSGVSAFCFLLHSCIHWAGKEGGIGIIVIIAVSV
jgi:hypothetical protein